MPLKRFDLENRGQGQGFRIQSTIFFFFFEFSIQLPFREYILYGAKYRILANKAVILTLMKISKTGLTPQREDVGRFNRPMTVIELNDLNVSIALKALH